MRIAISIQALDHMRGTATRNVFWATVSQVGRTLIQLVSTGIFAHMLPISDFGLVALAMIVMNFAYLLRDIGTSSAVIQKESVGQEFISTVFWINIALGTALAIAVAGLSSLAAEIFHEKRLTGILLMLSIVLPVAAAGSPHQALMERDHRFRQLASIEIFSALLGLLFGSAAVIYGFGVYGLVIQILVVTASSTSGLWMTSRWTPSWSWDTRGLMSVAKFSGNLVGFNIANYLTRNADSILVGRYLGVAELGIYNIGYRIMLLPLQNLAYVFNRALFPVYSRYQNDPFALDQKYMKTLRLISLLVAPLMAGLWILRVPLVHVFLGPHWTGVEGVLVWFAPTGYIQALLSTAGPIFMATGRTDTLRRLGIMTSIVTISSFLIGLKFGVNGVACAYFLAVVFVAVISIHLTLAQVGKSLHSAFHDLWPSIVASLTMTAAIATVADALPNNLSSIANLMILIPFGAIIYISLLLLLSKTVIQDLKTMNVLVQRT